MIRMILTIEQNADGDVSTKLASDGVQQGYTRREHIIAELIRAAINEVAGRKIASFEYVKDLPPWGGEKQQQNKP